MAKYHLTYDLEDGEARLSLPIADLGDFLDYIGRIVAIAELSDLSDPEENDEALDGDEWNELDRILNRIRVAAEEAGDD